MYFNIRNIPMFSGPYMITKVTHDVSESGFKTQFEGIRQPFYSLPTVDNFLQTLNEKLVSQLQTKVREKEVLNKAKSENVQIQASNTIANLSSEDTLTKNQDCAAQIKSRYQGFVATDEPTPTSFSTKDLYNTIVQVLLDNKYSQTGSTFGDLVSLMFTFVFVDSGTGNGSEIKAYENNFSTIDLTQVYADKFFEYINRRYYCVSRGSNPNLPVVSFRSLYDFLNFVHYSVRNLPTNIKAELQNFGDNELPFIYAKLYVLYYPVNQNSNVYTQIEKDKNQIDKLRQEFINAANVLTAILQ
jgi:hypothetical protein